MKKILFGIALILCHLITAYGRFIDTHKDIKSIQEMWTKVEDRDDSSKKRKNGYSSGCNRCCGSDCNSYSCS